MIWICKYLTARLQISFIHPPKLKIVPECQDAHLILHMKLSCLVEVQDGVKRTGVAVKEIPKQ